MESQMLITLPLGVDLVRLVGRARLIKQVAIGYFPRLQATHQST